MKVTCGQCRHQFDLPLKSVGKVEFARCRNLFRVNYRFRTPCPSCRTLLQLAPNGELGALGTAFEFDSSEVTERQDVGAVVEATVPRLVAIGGTPDPLPTVRVAPKTSRTAPSKGPKFQVTENTVKRAAPVHVPLRAKKKVEIPFLRILVTGVITAGVALTLALTFLAFKQDRPARRSSSVPPAVSPVETTEKSLGGPMEEALDPIDLADAALEEEEPVAPEPNAPALYLPRLEKLSSSYGVRMDPFSGKKAFHGGLDIAINQRAEVPAALPGKVEFVGRKGAYGNMVILSHRDGYETRYAHLTKALVKKGVSVKQGDPIGLVGSTGRSTGAHLHFEVRKDGKKTDPFRLELISRISDQPKGS